MRLDPAIDQSPAKPKRSAPWAPPVILACAVLMAYCDSFGGPFIFDDQASIQHNALLHSLWPDFHSPIYTTLSGRPLVSFSFALQYAIGTLTVQVCHGVNLAIHLAAALLTYLIVRDNLSNKSFWGDRFGRAAPWLACAAAAVWAVHPLNTQAVTYIVQRTESMSAMFYLGVIYAIQRSARSLGFKWEIAAVVCCLAAMACKEIAATAPLIAILYDRTFLADTFAGAIKKRGRLYAALAATWIPMGALLAMNARGGTVGSGHGISSLDYFRTQLGVVAHYLRLAIWPRGLVLDEDGWPIARSWSSVGAGGWLVVALGLGTLLALRFKPVLGFIGAWFFVILAPSSSFVPIVTEIAAEHRMYLPLAGLAVVAVVAGWDFFRRIGAAQFAAGFGMAIVVVLGIATYRRNLDYSSELTIWQTVLAHRPDNPRAHVNYGLALSQDRQYDRAIEQFCDALVLEPDNSGAAAELGGALNNGHHAELAQRFYARQKMPDSAIVAEVHMIRGCLLAEHGDLKLARNQLAAAAAMENDDPEVHYQLGLVLQQLGEQTGALHEFQSTLLLDKAYKDAATRAAQLQ